MTAPASTNTARVILAPYAPGANDVYDLTALTGGVKDTLGVAGYDGSDYILGENAGYYSKTMGANQARYDYFDDANAGGMSVSGYSNGVASGIDYFMQAKDYRGIDGVKRDVGPEQHKTNYLAINFSAAEQGIFWNLEANRDLKHMLVALEIGEGGTYEVNASLSTGEAASAQILVAQRGQRWFTLDWKSLHLTGADETCRLEVRKKTAGAGNLWVAFAVIYTPTKELLPGRGLRNMLAQTGFYGGKNQ